MATAGSPATAKPRAARNVSSSHHDGANAEATAISAAISSVIRMSASRPTASDNGPNTSNATPIAIVVTDNDSVEAAGVISNASASSGSRG